VRIHALTNNKIKLLTIILSQCSDGIKPKLEATPGYATAKLNHDCRWFLCTMKDICNCFESTKNRYIALVKAKANVLNYKQASMYGSS
jgi:hypothetical protein